MVYFRNAIFVDSTNSVFKIIMFSSYLALGLFALAPFSQFSLIYHLYILLWFGELAAVTYMAVTYDIIDDDNINSLVGSFVFISLVGSHCAILVNSWMMYNKRRPMFEKFCQLRETLQHNLLVPRDRRRMEVQLIKMVLLFDCLLIIAHGLIIWTTFETKTIPPILYWSALPSVLAVQFKTLEFLLTMVQVNYCILVMRRRIHDIGERNLRGVFKANANDKVKYVEVAPVGKRQMDEKQIEILKSAYNDMYAMFQVISRAYGWSLLATTTVDFVVFVCNIYWMLLLVITHSKDYYSLMQNSCFAVMAFILLSLLCLMCEQAYQESSNIGCLISKLVKPLGNKRYNDLVSEFSVQTLHQRFIITAKDFFNLNLGLLGSMVAAIVTYLVILIQFMFAERNNGSRLSSGSGSLVTTTMASNLSTTMSYFTTETIEG